MLSDQGAEPRKNKGRSDVRGVAVGIEEKIEKPLETRPERINAAAIAAVLRKLVKQLLAACRSELGRYLVAGDAADHVPPARRTQKVIPS